LVTSSVPAEGKTFVAANLAQSIIRQADRRVLLIDADLRASKLHLSVGAPPTPGLSDYLCGKVDEFAIVQTGPAQNLCFIPGGGEVSNPSELLLGEKMSGLLSRVTPLFDFVILDSPPATPVHDASLLADLCDGVLFIVRAGKTNFELAQKAVAEFKEKRVLGVVLNGADEKSAYSQYYYPYPRD
jgi:capsular exopolysaccharide synthesis family protein